MVRSVSAVGVAVVGVVAVSMLLWTPANAKPPAQAGPPTARVGTLVLPGLDPIPLYDVAWNVERPAPVGGGGGAGVATADPVAVVKGADASSPVIFGWLVTGAHLTTAHITLLDPTTQEVELELILEDVQIIGQSLGEEDATGAGVETVRLWAEQFTVHSGGESTCWDFTTNAACAP